MLRFLVVDDDDVLRLSIKTVLETRGYFVEEAEDGQQAVEKAKTLGPFDAAILDVNMPKMSGIEALSQIKELSPATFCLVVTAYSDIQDAIKAIKMGAYDYLEKPIDSSRILKLVDEVIEAKFLIKVAGFSAPSLQFSEGRDMIGESDSIQKVFGVIYKLAKVDTSVLIRGESGTGKELVARALHFNSHRKKGPFVAVNCAAIPESLIESELFGHEKGAFTGADKKKIGRFQYAAGGTIFLDEIGDISPQMQVKLLRVLQEKTFTPVGANQDIPTDVRIIAATNQPLEELIKNGKFRSDLFYRLNVLPIVLPPLRNRKEDIERLVDHMIEKFNKEHNKNIKTIDKQALAALKMYTWPGNIRELENVIEHAFIVEASETITLSSLPESIQAAVAHTQVNSELATTTDTAGVEAFDQEIDFSMLDPNSVSDLNFPALKEKFEKEFLIKALKAFNGRINQTALHTQMTKVTLLRKLEKYGINPREFYN